MAANETTTAAPPRLIAGLYRVDDSMTDFEIREEARTRAAWLQAMLESINGAGLASFEQMPLKSRSALLGGMHSLATEINDLLDLTFHDEGAAHG